ncbi:hypothetical protein CINS5995_07915, partial [Campylobacter insulaenigrae]|nr:hypothetical protein [Campylobacter insulaenigrae]MCR6580832.1 hypothetical protein [Campylobacter insulaenigrae]MCR6586967.1 hypothetical protein [Campylobacter insulaenigrae]
MFYKKSDLIDITNILSIKSSVELNFKSKTKFNDEKSTFFLMYSKKKYCLRCIQLQEIDLDITKIVISISIDSINWQRLEYKCDIQKNSTVITLNSCIYFKYIKIEAIAALSKLKFFATKFIGIIVSHRPDGFASRMWAFLNAMYLAKKSGFKFGFVWPKFDDVDGLISKKYITIDSENNMFSQTFIQNHSYTFDNLPQTHDYDNCLAPSSLQNIQRLSFYEEYGHLVTCCIPLYEFIHDIQIQKYQCELQNIWDNLQFSRKYMNIKNKVDDICNYLNNDFVAIHVRGGDIINGNHRYFIMSSLWSYLYPLELVIRLIEMLLIQKTKIVVFSDDEEIVDMIKRNIFNEKYNVNYLYFAKELTPKFVSLRECSFFNFQLLSKAKYIYGSQWSTFRVLAGFLGECESQKTILDIFSYDKQYKILNDNLEKIKTNKKYKAASCMYLYVIAKKINKNKQCLVEILKQGLVYDPHNLSFKIKMIDLLFECSIAMVEDEIKSIILAKKHEFVKLLFSKFYKIEFEIEWNNYLKFAHKDYPYISLIASFVAFYTGDIENYLKFYSYCKDNKEIQSITCKTFVFEIFQKNFHYLNQNIIHNNTIVTNYLTQIYSLKQQIYQNIITNTSLAQQISYLKTFSTAKQRIQNQLSYKLGQVMIVNSKNILEILLMPIYLLAIFLS